LRSSSLWRRGTSLLALVVLLGGALAFAPAASAQQAPAERPDSAASTDIPGALVVGVGTATLTSESYPEWSDDTVRVGLAAYMSPDESAAGVFSVTHREPSGELLADVHGYIECMRTEGEYAVTIGRITDVEKSPEAEVSEGMVAAIVVQDGGSDGDTMHWVFGPAEVEANCAEIPAQTAVPVEQGNFFVLD
jgi:hypothetical protein